MAAERRILYIGLQDDYGDPRRGPSYEYLNLYGTMTHLPNAKVDLFPFDRIMRQRGRRQMNKSLVEVIKELHPQLCFFVLFTDEIEKETLRWITEHSGAVTFNWFCDDHWRLHSFSRYWAPLFHWVSTTDPSAIEEYGRLGINNVILSQWGFNHYLDTALTVRNDLDVSFVGQVHSSRRKSIQHLDNAGIKVQCWGKGWANGRLNHDDMVSVFRRSKINLNFNQSSNVYSLRAIAKILLNRRADDSFHFNPVRQMTRNADVLFRARRAQIKARNFEIPGYGGFLMSSEVDHLSDYFDVGNEIVCFTKIDDLVQKIRYYLDHDDEREMIRAAGRKRTLRDHTYVRRMDHIFSTIGLS